MKIAIGSVEATDKQVKWAFRFGYLAGWAITAVAFMVLMTSMGWAQSRPSSGFAAPSSFGDVNSMWAGFRFILRIIATIMPAGLAAYYTWKFAKNAKDAYDGAWLVLAWCAVAYIIL